ncbi:MAG: aspartate aminotransferase family protein [Kofleriaceae bacterium]|nr:aspartate aminotransferase family protein [Kofleriaceae bacterium]MBP6836303.1 aspartate aminotransferase family protein [Kofleriaceae bacterium]
MTTRRAIPDQGEPAGDVLAALAAGKADDTAWRQGRVFSLVYHAGDDHERLLAAAHASHASSNLLNPIAFRSLRRLEAEVVEMAASLLHGPASTVGAVTSGGTESLLVALCAYRDHARRHRPWIRRPEIVVPRTIHPAFDKAAHYFGLRLRKVEVGPDLRADVDAMARAITRRTILLVGSAPQYPHGVVDPIAALGAVAARHDLPLHVDACVGGFVLPWVEALGRPVPAWDFRVDQVTSISADLHKYAYAGKGASVLLWRSMAWMKHQFFVAADFPGGAYVSPTLLGTRPGGPIAAAWAALRSQGRAGYLALTERALTAADQLRAGIAAIPGLEVLGHGDATIVAYAATSGGPDVFAVADRLEARGWSVDRQHRPTSIHLTVTANHLAHVEAYLADLRAAAAEVTADPHLRASGNAAMYGMVAKVPVRGLIRGALRKVMEDMYAPGAAHAPAGASAVADDGAIGRLLARHGDKVGAALDALEQVRARLGRRRR